MTMSDTFDISISIKNGLKQIMVIVSDKHTDSSVARIFDVDIQWMLETLKDMVDKDDKY